MDIVQFRNIRKNFSPLCERQFTSLFVDDEQRTVCKIFEPDFVISILYYGYDLVKLVLEGSKLVKCDDIIVPNGIVYSGKYFAGYLMDFFDGKSIYDFPFHPYKLPDIYLKIERIIKNLDNIVFPDLLTDGNILINKKMDIKLIDFDGLQINDFSTPFFSCYMGHKSIYDGTKYKNGNLYTKQLDVKSLIYLYMKLLLGVDMGFLDNYDGVIQEYQVDKFFKDLGIDNDNLVNRILALYKSDDENLYLGNVVNEIRDNYFVDLVLDSSGRYIKKLVRK